MPSARSRSAGNPTPPHGRGLERLVDGGERLEHRRQRLGGDDLVEALADQLARAASRRTGRSTRPPSAIDAGVVDQREREDRVVGHRGERLGAVARRPAMSSMRLPNGSSVWTRATPGEAVGRADLAPRLDDALARRRRGRRRGAPDGPCGRAGSRPRRRGAAGRPAPSNQQPPRAAMAGGFGTLRRPRTPLVEPFGGALGLLACRASPAGRGRGRGARGRGRCPSAGSGRVLAPDDVEGAAGLEPLDLLVVQRVGGRELDRGAVGLVDRSTVPARRARGRRGRARRSCRPRRSRRRSPDRRRSAPACPAS